jgi:hypothetical protein
VISTPTPVKKPVNGTKPLNITKAVGKHTLIQSKKPVVQPVRLTPNYVPPKVTQETQLNYGAQFGKYNTWRPHWNIARKGVRTIKFDAQAKNDIHVGFSNSLGQ